MLADMIFAAVPPPVFAWGGVALAVLMLLLALRAGRRKRLVDNTPTSKTQGVFIGFVEVKGTAESERPFRSALAEMPCVWYSWKIEERWERTVTETYTDDDGKRKTREKTESGWTTVASGGEEQLFYLRDDGGTVRVDPHKAKIETSRVFSRSVGRSDPLYFGKGPDDEITDSDHRRRFTEQAVALHADLYVMGQARERDDVIAPEIAHDPVAPMFLISTRSEKQISRGLGCQFWVLGILGIIAAAVGWAVADKVVRVDPAGRIGTYLGIAAAAAGVWTLGWVWMVYNSMMDLKHRVNQAWSNVDVQLRRRHDLIPNLVRCLQGLAEHERTVQTEIAFLRSQAGATAPGEAGADPQGCAPRLIALREAYPELNTHGEFLALQVQLSDTENRIALARSYYNEIVSHHNLRRQIVPDRFVATLAGLKPRQYITAEDFERAAVEVKLVD
jgi:hypothetical protein